MHWAEASTHLSDYRYTALALAISHTQPDVIWADGAGDAKCTHDSVKYWKAPEFLSWLYNDSPVKETVIANKQVGQPCLWGL